MIGRYEVVEKPENSVLKENPIGQPAPLEDSDVQAYLEHDHSNEDVVDGRMNLADDILIIVGTHAVVLALQFYFLSPRGLSAFSWQIAPDRFARRPFDDVEEGD